MLKNKLIEIFYVNQLWLNEKKNKIFQILDLGKKNQDDDVYLLPLFPLSHPLHDAVNFLILLRIQLSGDCINTKIQNNLGPREITFVCVDVRLQKSQWVNAAISKLGFWK